jgi:hypothetical protein
MLPRASNAQEMRSPEFAEKMLQGPVAILTMIPSGPWRMGRQLALWFLYLTLVSVFSAYLAGRALAPGADYLQVFRFAGTTAFLSHSVALWQMSIWYKRGWGLTLKATVDGLIYALLTAGTFGALWPR